MTDAALDSHRARLAFYASLAGQEHAARKRHGVDETDLGELARALTALIFGYKLGVYVAIDDETPSDMDGIVLKVTIT